MSSFETTAFEDTAFDVEVTVTPDPPEPEDPDVDTPTAGEGHYLPVTTADTVIADTIEVTL